MPLGVSKERLWCPISDEGGGWRGYYRISPERQRKKWLRWVAHHPVRREEETSVMWVAHKLSLHEGSSPQLCIVPVGGQRSVGHRRCAPFNSRVAGKEADQGSLRVFFLCLLLQFKNTCFNCLSSSASPASYRNIHSRLSETMWLANEAAWGALPSLIPGQSQINRVSVSMAVWPLSHIKSGPFRLFDLTSISHVIDSPRDLFFSPISDSVSTFSANSLDNTRHSPSCTAVWVPTPHSSPAF